MIELKSSDDMESLRPALDEDDINTRDNHNQIFGESRLPSTIRCFLCLVFLLVLTNAGSIVLWLSESQFSHGVLRYRYLDEPCENDGSCAKGFVCDYVSTKCKSKPEPCSPYDDFYNYGNGTPTNYSHVLSCPPCEPPACPPQTIQKQFTYFDFNEFPNHWIDPGTHGFYNRDYNIPYGGCKEICARDYRCKGVCYNGLAQLCWQMAAYTLPPTYNSTYTCAIKTLN